MRAKSKFILLLGVGVLTLIMGTVVLADDGQMFRRNISKTPDGETEEAGIMMMPFYVPAQAADGTLLDGIEYYDKEGVLVDTREFARPLVSIYIDGLEHDEGAVTPARNSYVLGGDSIEGGAGFGERDAFAAVSLDDGATWKLTNLSRAADLSSFTLRNGEEYPGDAYRYEFSVVDNKILAVWMSRYCTSGTPAYAMVDDLGDPLYPDLFGVAGSQGSVDYTAQGYPEVGEIPYGCVWTARGTLEYDEETGLFDVLWRKPERLTSGRRDPNVQAVAGAKGAGFVVFWQEDPDGLRPGQGLGPGEGWSGAIVNQKTDVWYTRIAWDDFDGTIVDDEDPDAMPKVETPMMVPIRLTDNNMCKFDPTYDDEGGLINPYCYEDFNMNGTADFCAEEVLWENPGGTTLHLCKTEDNRVLWGRTGASRVRLSLFPYTRADQTIGAWVVLAYEETKALGEGSGDVDPIDIGKDVMYHTFDPFVVDNELEVVAPGNQLNQPAKDPLTGNFYEIVLDEWGNEFYDTEIARRFNIIGQGASKAGPSGTVLLAIFKQGIINQGGPADIYVRRFVLPAGFDSTVDNPYDFSNMVCDEWAYTDGTNPNYLNGLCMDTPQNVSSPSIVTCDLYADPDACAAAFPWEGGEVYPKVEVWLQEESNLDDQSWENPYDVAKGHRGLMEGDFIMMLYAWSPNWKANSVGNDKYNLYVRRSFDGGETWTTTPAALGGDGTCHTEHYLDDTEVEYCYTPGEFEQGRNVSELTGTRVTVLDPRYAPSGTEISYGSIVEPEDYTGPFFFPEYWDDIRNPSMFFVVYETGDNTTVAEGEATPLDLFYSRGYNYGDDYDYVEYLKDGEVELRWDWLENKQEDLSGEAALTVNPGGTFLYAAWNQWQELVPDEITESDVIFRRVMYIDTVDGMPSAEIIYCSHDAIGHNLGGEVTFIGTAIDNDHLGDGIVQVRWVSNLDGLLSTESGFSIPVTDLSPGFQTITFSAQDDEGNWAVDDMVILVAEFLHRTYMPYVPE
jgi:hypothetical protein